MRKILFILSLFVLSAQSAVAASRIEIEALFDLLSMDAMFEVMREEGLVYSDDLADDMLPGGTGPGWQNIARRIHDPAKMRTIVQAEFEASFGDADAAPLLDFFASETGQKIVALEVQTRRAFLDEAVSDKALELFHERQEPYDPHLQAIADYVEANELIEYNVTGALNSNFMFYRGLVEGGAFAMSEQDILREVWTGEDDTRVETRDWLFSFLMVAYEPLNVEAIASYVDLSKTTEGQALNRALFAGFDEMYKAISLSLGMALARQMQGETL
ncbi:hypothetical protein TG4357_00122 [Thalassovita gelatinovora]|uniref:DUF2059 domain-containing protein n=1 Tax=Thalassovita gelatinovora TaxID=53501 RepID=A0A0N7LU44_THAGE|nr:DUF2059 domain-containing protein [Thalassovita gelatinovora]QIZ79265.1 DUF2059 domain-containing protein [Thalassovita gelatinovora]CUH62466.1 hypothetical protein TG4357_00122 [Thalassovita gelatinovora]SEQ04871.1 hypothetical protein SAMN04488043_10322 [Thalassovita gelatinovora]